MPVRTMLYGALCCSACLLLETFYRRVNTTIPFILGLLSPVTAFFVDSFSFPIRIQLTAWAGRLIALAGLPVSVAGNTITFRDHAFSVDHACEGLHLLLLSLLTALLVINYYQTQYRRRLRTVPILILLVTTVILNIVTNLFRIICLVVLAIVPSNPLHHLLGLVFLLTHILLPLLLLIRWTIRRWGALQPEDEARPVRSRSLLIANITTASSVLLILGLRLHAQKAHAAPLAAGYLIPGYTIKEREDSVLQLDNGRSLVYIKPVPGFYYTDHTPTLCWLGSASTPQDLDTELIHILKARPFLPLLGRAPAPGRVKIW